ncbi:hypothetical protein PVAND_002469 [Polypedilum vanderplanki]|uniref:non-specific serine/threonine protein kinase n=1 Tax=Polypedilum vanderplanki TaxID=319348 RepID=A0A9J6BRB0_POLVA|nr:hypothetical protein PVAND_002469 [Polypedilum vanderplanki]
MTSSDSESEVENSLAWSKLETNKEFDVKSNQKMIVKRNSSTDEIDTGRNNRLFNLTPSISCSLLVQSLLKQLCSFIETDQVKSSDMYAKICKKLHEFRMIDESYERSEFENIRASYEAAITALVNVTKETSQNNEMNLVEWPLKNDKRALEWSRYHRDFIELEKISSGGFGDVYKAMHNLDNNIYAIKKILIKSTSVKNILSHLREVKTFASLNHINVVPYKSCWLEPLISYEQEKTIYDDESWTTKSESTTNIRITKSNDNSLRLQTNDSFSINFEYSENHQSEQVKSADSSIMTNGESHSQVERLRKLNLSKSNGSTYSLAIVPHVKLAWSVLYIQMKLCQKTLRNFLDERNEHECFKKYYENVNLRSDNLTYTALSIFKQICNGLEYIHSKSIVHHDLKPANVFVSFEKSNNKVTFSIGDFGLACPLDNNEMLSHNGIGTRLYAAKEQFEGRICSKKSDIYSLGVILIELLLPCKTVMECFKKVEKIKKGELLPEIEANLCKLIGRLLSQRAELRPDVSELKSLIRHFMDNTSDEVARLKNIIEDKDKQIDDLMQEIRNLKKQLSKET